MQRPKALQDLWTLNGSVRLDTKASDRRYMSQQVLFIEYVDNCFSKLKSQYDQLIALHLGTMKCMNQISDIYDQLRQTTKNVNMMFPQQMKFQNFEPIINNISHLHKEWANSFQTQAKILQTQIKHMFKYQNTNINTIKQLHKTLISTFDTYQKRVDRQVPSREPYQSKKLSQFKVYAQSPSKNIQVLRHQAAYCQTQFKQQTLRYIDQLGKKLGNKFLIFCTLQLSIAGDLDIVWRQFQKFIQK